MLTNVHRCHQCLGHTGGPYVCPIDRQPITVHAVAGLCPLGKFDGKDAASGPAQSIKASTSTADLWRELHRRPFSPTLNLAEESQWLASWAARVPCGECRQEYAAIVKGMPPDLSSAEAYWQWTYRLHSLVNAKLGKLNPGEGEARKAYELPPL